MSRGCAREASPGSPKTRFTPEAEAEDAPLLGGRPRLDFLNLQGQNSRSSHATWASQDLNCPLSLSLSLPLPDVKEKEKEKEKKQKKREEEEGGKEEGEEGE